MAKITLEICIGTTCYVMGGVDLLQIEDILPEHLKDSVEIKGAPCMDDCFKANSVEKPPFVRINGRIIGDATTGKVLQELETLYNLNEVN